MNNIMTLIFGVTFIIAGIGIILWFKNDNHILVPLAYLGAITIIITGLIYLVTSLPQII